MGIFHSAILDLRYKNSRFLTVKPKNFFFFKKLTTTIVDIRVSYFCWFSDYLPGKSTTTVQNRFSIANLWTPMFSALNNLKYNLHSNSVAIILSNIIAKTNKYIRFTWTPGHCGIDGNEKADELARETTLWRKCAPIPHLLTSMGMLASIVPIYGNPNAGVHQITDS